MFTTAELEEDLNDLWIKRIEPEKTPEVTGSVKCTEFFYIDDDHATTKECEYEPIINEFLVECTSERSTRTEISSVPSAHVLAGVCVPVPDKLGDSAQYEGETDQDGTCPRSPVPLGS